jgi:hypothetical protein
LHDLPSAKPDRFAPRLVLDFTADLPIIWAVARPQLISPSHAEDPEVTVLVADDVRALARLAGLQVRDEDAQAIAERLTATLALLAAVPDELLDDAEPAFVLPMTIPPA